MSIKLNLKECVRKRMSEVFKIVGKVDLEKIKAELKGKKVSAQFALQQDENGIGDATGSHTN